MQHDHSNTRVGYTYTSKVPAMNLLYLKGFGVVLNLI